ncbi:MULTISPECIES: DUF882 domain-containing protein [Nitrosomonas]|uniref:Murein endopeptidase K n=2 Tax=Nitrosomonas eutropha TaxID=916 RepID=A0ABX5M5D3_9PROT|nr:MULTISPECIES: DUF882 domain-containing protein [Nitrosomonas]ABI60735.1 Twin-arginine translocation pathway signal [Nitrosomonas eutropha C91]MXS80136.1 DUF882 domain-containing protein [Nitrosomonas sp. GH22]PXV79411.1 uncharacterized protein YcbK (DUF882 family) [Nitrosomonas eutropha]SCX23417.1 Uncharacterized conserved protein YcbK, DUF882 family [Nitrosomonas eutropha]SEI48954.1 Uncharacterized conserved protein YcbK, DUF882 family [Nitrosomonas eutropha]
MSKLIIADNLETLTAHGNSRRRLLQASLGACALFAMPAANAANSPRIYEKRLSLLNLHTGERIRTAYWEQGKYIPEALQAIAKVLRDHRSGERHPIDPGLLDLIQHLHHKTGSSKEFQVISGYRSPATNATLAAKSHGVAKKSLHMQGKAIDIRLPGVPLNALRRAAMSMRVGGVGYYPESNFIHVDTGNVRYW